MLQRYQIGPLAVIGLSLVLMLMLAFGLHRALWMHRWTGWVCVATAVLTLFNFHKRFYRGAD